MSIVLEQLKDLKLYNEHRSQDPGRVKLYYYREDNIEKVAISIQVPIETIDEWAEKLNLRCNITALNFHTSVSTAFDRAKLRHYNCFSAAEQLEAVEEFFEQQLDLAGLKEQGVVEDHFHLHKRLAIDEIQHSFKKYQTKLCCRMACCSYSKYVQPLNMVKNYYGEKVAFEYAFLLHYQSWLIYASIAGMCLVCYQWNKWARHNYDMTKALDTEFNVIMGVFIALWATCFLESWKRHQEYFNYIWCTDERDYTEA